MKLITILGARPQFIKAATVSRALIEYNLRVTDPAQRIDEKIPTASLSMATPIPRSPAH